MTETLELHSLEQDIFSQLVTYLVGVPLVDSALDAGMVSAFTQAFGAGLSGS